MVLLFFYPDHVLPLWAYDQAHNGFLIRSTKYPWFFKSKLLKENNLIPGTHTYFLERKWELFVSFTDVSNFGHKCNKNTSVVWKTFDQKPWRRVESRHNS